jgi:hypothetical protein
MRAGAYRCLNQLSEMTAVRKTLLKTLGISVATAALAVFAYGASAQEKKAAAPTPAATKAPACKTIKAQAGCEARTADCTWVAESKDDKGKVKAKAYCRAKPKEAAKKPEPKKAEPKK